MKVVELSGGVGGARMARGLAAIEEVDLTVVVNVGDDLPTHGLYVAPDLDTMVYTLAGLEGPHGWGRAGDTFTANGELARFGVDNTFLLGDRDLALKLYRTMRLAEGDLLSEVTDSIRAAFDIGTPILPATDDTLRTVITTDEGSKLSFQEYFVTRRHADHVRLLDFAGADTARPAPGVIEAIRSSDVVVIGPSNPPLSIWPILAVAAIDEAVRAHPRVIAISPLIGGRAVKGPADSVLADLGLGAGTAAVVAAYDGLISTLVVDNADSDSAGERDGVEILATSTLIPGAAEAEALARSVLAL